MTETEQRLARERAERETASADFGRRLAAALSSHGARKWAYQEPVEEDRGRHVSMNSAEPLPLRLWFWWPDAHERGPAKVTIHYSVPAGERGYGDPSSSISVSTTRPIDAIAKDVIRRLMPDAEECARLQTARAARMKASTDEAQKWADRIAAEIPDALNWTDGRYGLQVPSSPGTHPRIDVTEGKVVAQGHDGTGLDALEVTCFGGSTDGFTLTLYRLPLEAWPFVVEVIRKAQTYSKKEGAGDAE